MAEEHLPVFVYGTLQRGEVRSHRWPRPPVKVESATIRGLIRDLGPYPALVPGDGMVLGELWHLRAQDLEQTLRVLDEIECYGNEEVDLYVRRVVECATEEGAVKRGYTYFIANPESVRDMPIVAPDEQGRARWRRFGAAD